MATNAHAHGFALIKVSTFGQVALNVIRGVHESRSPPYAVLNAAKISAISATGA